MGIFLEAIGILSCLLSVRHMHIPCIEIIENIFKVGLIFKVLVFMVSVSVNN